MSVFAEYRDETFDLFEVTLRLNDRLIGGQPKDPRLVEAWLSKNMGLEGEELKSRVVQHLQEMGVDIPASATMEEMQTAVAEAAGEIKTQGFKRTTEGKPYIESRHIKAMLKESTNIVFPRGEHKFGQYRNKSGSLVGGKSPRDYVAERVFVKPEVIVVADEISGLELAIGHIEDWRSESGSRSTIGYFEYVEQPEIDFLVEARRDCLSAEQWGKIWTHAENNGLGAMRSQGYGQFVVTKWNKIR